ncbi:MAG: LPS export ABC transporter permease LptF [Candidatus Methylomirabilales bacterium]
MKIIDRYIAWELFTSMAVGLGLFTFVLLTDKILELMDLIITKKVPVGIVFRLFVYTLPKLFVLTAPMALLLAVTATYGRLAADQEFTALKTAGCSFYRLTRPAFIIGTLTLLFTAFNTFYALPYGGQAFRDLLFVLARTRATVGIKERVFNDDFHGLILYANHIDATQGFMKGVFVVDTQDEENPRIIMAHRGRVVPDQRKNVVLLKLEDGSTHITPRDAPEHYQILNFRSLNLALSLRDPATAGKKAKDPEEMMLPELLTAVRERSASGIPTADLRVNFHHRFAAPAACLVFVLLGTPLAIRVRRSGRGISLGLTIILGMIYYILMISGRGMGNQEIIPPFVASWLPNLVFSGVGLLLFMGANTDSWMPPFLQIASRRGRSMPETPRTS